MDKTNSSENLGSDSNKALLYKSMLFSIFFILIWLFLVKTDEDYDNRIYLSELEITKTGLLSCGLIVGLWMIYLIFLMKDNTLGKLWDVFRLRGTFGDPGKTAVRWYILLLMFIISVFSHLPDYFPKSMRYQLK